MALLYFSTLLLRFFTLLSDSQDVSGTWEGTLYQDPGGTRTEYYFRMELKQYHGKVTGFSYISHLDEKDVYGKMNVTGTVAGDVFTFTETALLDEKKKQDMYWCIKSGKLKIDGKGRQFALKGDWQAPTCSPGTLQLTKLIKKP